MPLLRKKVATLPIRRIAATITPTMAAPTDISMLLKMDLSATWSEISLTAISRSMNPAMPSRPPALGMAVRTTRIEPTSPRIFACDNEAKLNHQPSASLARRCIRLTMRVHGTYVLVC